MLKLKPHAGRDTVQQPAFCSLPFTKLILNSWGDVSMCCHQLTQLGKLTEDKTVLDLWNSPLAKAVRSRTAKGNLHPVCASWNSCPYMTKERKIGPISMYRNAAYPIYLEICLPDKHCNVGGETPSDDNPACIMCKRNFRTPAQQDLTDFLCEKARPLMPYLKFFCVLGVAEPFWKDAVFRMLEKVEFHRYKHQIQFTTNTNGICLKENRAHRFFNEVVHSDLSWSIDSATRETYIKIRRLDTFDLIIDNLRRWIKIREEYGGAAAHRTSIYNNINLLNVQEMVGMVELAVDVGVDEMIMLPTYDQHGIVKLGELVLCEKNVHIFKEYSEKAMRRAEELGLKLLYQNRFDVVPPSRTSDLIQLQV